MKPPQTRQQRPMSESGSTAADLLSLMPDGGVLLDGERLVKAINPAAAQILRVPIASVLGRSFVSVLQTKPDVWSVLIERIELGEKSETLVKLPDGRAVLACLRSVQRAGTPGFHLLVTLRDLDVIDHERRLAASPSGRTGAFRFASDRKLRPDLRRQRLISADLDSVMTMAERTIIQGARLLILGESGVGKTELARYLHEFADEERTPFVHVNCGSISETLFEAELFGYERGAFTGALASGRKGYIEVADGGTLFLDEVGEVPLAMQSRMLKFLETGTIQRVGSSEERTVRVRVISATNRNLEDMVSCGEFRKDLYFRLAVVPVRVKPLREAPELINEICDYFLTIINQTRATPLRLSPECRERLGHYAFPGNIRELFNVLQQLSVVAENAAAVEHLPAAVRERVNPAIQAQAALDADLKHQVRIYERAIIERAIATYGSKRKAAEALGVDIGTIVRKTQVRH